MGRRLVALLALVAVLAAAAFLLTGESSEVDADAADAKVLAIAERVEDIRGLRFKDLPKMRRVPMAQLKREATQQQAQLSGRDRAELEATGELLKLLGFISGEADLANTPPDVSQIAGTYEFDSEQLTIVRDAKRSQVPVEIVYAHELAHALEDDAIGIEDPARKGDDAATAYRAFVEGTATFLETQYARRHMGGAASSRQIATADPASTEKGATGPEFYSTNSDRFSYLDGARFVARLHRAGGWRLIDDALRNRPPQTTEEILHPQVYLDRERQTGVKMNYARLARGHRRLAAGQLGEFDTSQMLLMGAKAVDDISRAEAATAAEGWDGGRYELWQKRSGPSCSQPCIERDVLVLKWAWDSPDETAEFVALLPGYLERYLGLRPAGRMQWRGKGVAAALAVAARETTLVLGPQTSLARSLANQ